jgi:hypothetical protein
LVKLVNVHPRTTIAAMQMKAALTAVDRPRCCSIVFVRLMPRATQTMTVSPATVVRVVDASQTMYVVHVWTGYKTVGKPMSTAEADRAGQLARCATARPLNCAVLMWSASLHARACLAHAIMGAAESRSVVWLLKTVRLASAATTDIVGRVQMAFSMDTRQM